MRNLKKVLSLALVFVMVFALMVSASAAYSDQDQIENKAAVELITALKIMTGRSGAFDPTANVQRGEMAKMIYIAMNGVDDKAELYATLTNPFSDVGNTVEEYWGVNYVKWANYKGVISGKSPTMFYPKDDVKGIEAAKMILVAMGFDAKVEGYQDNANWEFNIAEDAKNYGLLAGLSYDCLKRPLTRDEAALMLANGLRAGTIEYMEIPLPNGDTIKVTEGFYDDAPLTSEVFGLEEYTDYLVGTKDAGIDGFSAPDKDAKGNDIETVTLESMGSVQGTADASLLGHKVNVYYKSGDEVDVLYGLFDEGSSVERTELNEDKDEEIGDAVISVNGQETAAPAVTDGVTVKYVGTVDEDGIFTPEYALYTQAFYGTATLTKDAVTDEKDEKVKYDGVALAGGVTVDAADLKASDVKGAETLVADVETPVIISTVYESDTKTSYSISAAAYVDGKITAKDNKGNVTINGQKYALADMTGKTATAGELVVAGADDEAKRYYVYGNKIVAVGDIPGATVVVDQYGLLLGYKEAVIKVDGTGLDDGKAAADGKVYLLTADNKMSTYDVASIAGVDAIAENSLESTYGETIEEGKTKIKEPVVVKYSLTADGKINMGAKIETDDTVNGNYLGTSVLNADKGTAKQYIVNDSTVFFTKTDGAGDYPYAASVGKANAVKIADDATIVVDAADGVAKMIYLANESEIYDDSTPTEATVGFIFGYTETVDGIIVNMYDGSSVQDYTAVPALTAAALNDVVGKLVTYTLVDGKLSSADASVDGLTADKYVTKYVEGAYVTIADDDEGANATSIDLAANCKLVTIDTTAGTATAGADLTETVKVSYMTKDGAVSAIYVIK